jgi:quercetin dioxygenase-like cupin family protein
MTPERLHVLGDIYTFLHSGPSSSVLQVSSAAGHGPPPHIDEREDEAIFVIDGEITVTIAGVDTQVREGDFIFLPKRVVHTYRVTSTTARLLVNTIPGEFQQQLDSLGILVEPGMLPANIMEAQIKRLVELAPEYRLHLVGAN